VVKPIGNLQTLAGYGFLLASAMPISRRQGKFVTCLFDDIARTLGNERPSLLTNLAVRFSDSL